MTLQKRMHVFYTHLAMYLSSYITMLLTTATLGNFFKQFEKVAKCWQPLAMMATYWRTGDGGQWCGNPPQPSVATRLPAQFRLVWMGRKTPSITEPSTGLYTRDVFVSFPYTCIEFYQHQMHVPVFMKLVGVTTPLKRLGCSWAGACFSYRKVRIVRNLRFVNLGTFLRRSVIAFLEALRK